MLGGPGRGDGLDEIPVQAIYGATDFLIEHGEEIQKAVIFSASTLSSFTTLTSTLGLRPRYRRLPERIEAQVLLS